MLDELVGFKIIITINQGEEEIMVHTDSFPKQENGDYWEKGQLKRISDWIDRNVHTPMSGTLDERAISVLNEWLSFKDRERGRGVDDSRSAEALGVLEDWINHNASEYRDYGYTVHKALALFKDWLKLRQKERERLRMEK